MRPVYFDIETEVLAEQDIAPFTPEFEAPSNYKDPEKIREAIEAKRRSWMDKAALDARTGKVLCIGLMRPVCTSDEPIFDLLEGEEDEILTNFWLMFAMGEYDRIPWVGFNIKHFDVEFLKRRSWVNGVSVPSCAFYGRWLSPRFIDLMEIYGDQVSLDHLAKLLKVGEKNGHGKDFAKLWHAEKDKAVEYLRNDLALVYKAAKVMTAENWFPKENAPSLERVKE